MKSFLAARFRPEHLIEFRIIRDGSVRRTWSRLSQLHVTEGKLRRFDSAGWNVYAGVNPRGTARSNEAAVSEAVSFHVDIDCEPSQDVPGVCRFAANGDTRERENLDAAQPGAKSFLSLCALGVKRPMEAPLPEPSMVVSSGHGLHCYWILHAPVAVSDANREQLKSVNRGLALAVGGDAACCDLSRVLRVPTFHNHKQQPPTEVILLADSSWRYTVEQLEPFAVACNARTLQPLALPETVPLMSPELQERFAALRRRDGQLSKAWKGELGDGSSDSRYALALRLLEADFSPEEILTIVTSRTWYNRRSRKVRAPEGVARDVRALLGKIAYSSS